MQHLRKEYVGGNVQECVGPCEAPKEHVQEVGCESHS